MNKTNLKVIKRFVQYMAVNEKNYPYDQDSINGNKGCGCAAFHIRRFVQSIEGKIDPVLPRLETELQFEFRQIPDLLYFSFIFGTIKGIKKWVSKINYDIPGECKFTAVDCVHRINFVLSNQK